MSSTTSFLHDGSIGDVWASLPAIRENYKKTGKKAILYLTNGQAAFYYEGATHPTRNENNVQVLLNEEIINMMIPLLMAQPYIEDARIHKDEPIDLDLNAIRHTFINMPNGSLARWYFIVYPDLACDLSEKYIFAPETDKDFAKGKIIVSRTERYQNDQIEYSFLKKYEGNLVFSGTKKEYNLFCMNNDLDIPKLQISNFLELAQALKQAKGLLSNQTQIFQIAEGLKTPRVAELCKIAPNVIPVGEKAYDYYAQEGLEYYFHELNGTMPDFAKMMNKREIKKPELPGFDELVNPIRSSVEQSR